MSVCSFSEGKQAIQSIRINITGFHSKLLILSLSPSKLVCAITTKSSQQRGPVASLQLFGSSGGEAVVVFTPEGRAIPSPCGGLLRLTRNELHHPAGEPQRQASISQGWQRN
jgi:hypothetical protein